MKVTFAIGSLGAGGKERQLLYLMKYLPKDIRKQLIVFSDDIFYDYDFKSIDDLIIIPRKDKYKLKTLFNLYKKVKDFSPDFIHCWDRISPLLFKPYTLMNDSHLIYGGLRTGGPQLSEWDRKIKERILINIADQSICNSEMCINELNLKKSDLIKCIYNGFNINSFNEQMETVEDNRSEDDICRICMIGRFFAPKDHEHFLRVAQELNSIVKKKIEFILVGDGPNLQRIKTQAKELNLTNVLFLGKRNDIPSLLSTYDIGVLFNPLNKAEGLSNAIMEYMAASLPVVATNAGGTPELVEDKKSGFLVNTSDVQTSVNYLFQLIEDEKMRKEMGRRGRMIIENDFSIDKMISSYIKLYNKLSGEINIV